MAEYEWLCMMIMSLDDFAASKDLHRFRRALSDAADAVREDIDEASRQAENVIPFPRVFKGDLNSHWMNGKQEDIQEVS